MLSFGIIIMMFLGTVYSYSVFRILLEQAFDIEAAQSGLPYMTALAFYAIFMFITGWVYWRRRSRNHIWGSNGRSSKAESELMGLYINFV